MTEVDVQAFASLSASLDSFTAEMRAARLMQEKAAAECWYVEAPAIIIPTAAPLAYAPPAWGPNTGYCWAVQRITYCPLGDNDNITVYRGHTNVDIQGQNALYTLIPQTGYINSATWHPGRVGLVLMPDESLVFGGSSAAGGALSVDVIQVTLANLPALLL
jgi:hypothetical protein